MKPEKLILCGWGPYREKQEIDFTSLEKRGLFLITGATGAGKTTVFDAVTYALYGSMSGAVREKSSVRSDFADAATPTYVELFMKHGGKPYHIYRNPEYLRPKKRKTGKEDFTKEKENAVLTLPDGTKIEGSTEVTRKVQEILCLDYRQFKQLSMLAQGEFARLLTAAPGEKSRIFREIFDTGLYDRIAAGLRARSAGLYKQVMEYRHKMEEDVVLFSPGEELKEKWDGFLSKDGCYYDGILLFLKQAAGDIDKKIKELKAESKKAEEETEKIAGLVAEGEQTKNLTDQLNAEKKHSEELLERKEEMEKKRQLLLKAEAAGEVRVWEEKAQSLAEQLRQQEDKRKSLEEDIMQLRLREQEERNFYEQADQIREAYAAFSKETEAGQLLKAEEAVLKKLKEELAGLQKEYLLLETEEEAAGHVFEQADKRYRHGVAGILAKELEEGIPCPVCGATTHPLKAELEEKMPSEAEVEQKKQLYEKKREQRVSLQGKTIACKERADASSLRMEELNGRLQDFLQKKNEQPVFIKEYLKKYSEEEFFKQKKEYEALLTTLTEKEKLRKEREEELSELAGRVKQAKEAYEREKKAKGFSDDAAYKSAFLPEQEREKIRKNLERYGQDCHASQHLIAHLEGELAGRKEVDLTFYREQLYAKRKERDRILAKASEAEHQKKDMMRLKASLSEKLEKSEKLSRQYGMVKKLDDAANGNNRLRLVFEQYVLAAYFEEILKAANLRLGMMSGGRYELKRTETVGDGRSKDSLEMEVLDYYTGKYRSVKTLSGGETFKVSLSLALGMSDVVQAFSGGIRVETLFIDEGFGSLDGESLDQACLTLTSLVEKDRLIGIISHVPELAEKIGNQIKIQKTNAGSTIEVMVS